jgi:hypothetical protein
MAGSTTTTREYPFSDTPNTKVNVSILQAEAVAAGPYGGGAISEVAVATQGTDVYLTFDGLLEAADETTLDGVIAAHQGEDFSLLPETEFSETESTDDSGAEQTKLTLSSGPLPEGSYILSWYCEIKTAGEVAGTAAQARLFVDKNGGGEVERGEKSWQYPQYNQFSGSMPFSAKAGDTYDLRIAYERIGGTSNPVSIQRARLGIARLS